MTNSLNEKIPITVLGSVNILLTALLIVTYFTSKKLQNHPSGIIISLAFCELASSYHNIIFMWDETAIVESLSINKMRVWRWMGLSSSSTMDVICSINVTIFLLGTIAGIFYNYMLCIDLILSLRNPFTSAFKRMPLYHILVFLMAGSIGAYMSYMNSKMICFKNIKLMDDKRKVLESIFMIPIISVYVLLALISIIYAAVRIYSGVKISNIAMKRYLTRHLMYVAVNIIIWSTCVVNFAQNRYMVRNQDGLLDTITLYIISTGGVILAVIRSTDPAFIFKVMSGKTFVMESDQSSRAGDEWNVPVSSILSELSAELGVNIFDSMFSVYQGKLEESTLEISKKMQKETKLHRGERASRLASVFSESEKNVYTETIEYAPRLFDMIRKDSGISNSEMLKSLDPIKNIDSIISANESKGKSGSFFMFSKDGRFVIKTVKAKEITVLISMLASYTTYLRENPKSLLCRVFGAFYMKFSGVSPIYIIIMDNVMKYLVPTKIYDLKGSTLNRKTKLSIKTDEEQNNKDSFIGPFKDLDFVNSHRKLEFAAEEYETVKNYILSDSQFLQGFNIMDYSLIVGIREENGVTEHRAYGIIDYLTSYGLFKRVERAFTVLINPKASESASVINPKKYAQRFSNFLIGKVLEKKN